MVALSLKMVSLGQTNLVIGLDCHVSVDGTCACLVQQRMELSLRKQGANCQPTMVRMAWRPMRMLLVAK